MRSILSVTLILSFLAIASIAQPPPPPGSAATLVINEVDYDQPSTDTAEFIEIYNYGTAAVSMNQVILALINGFDSQPYDTIVFPPVSLAAGDYYVVCGSGGNVANCDQMQPSASNIIQNGDPDAMVLFDIIEQEIVDALSYEGDVIGIVETAGVPTNESDNNDDNEIGLSRFPNGTDTDNNGADFSMRCITPGEANDSNNTNCDGLVGIRTNTMRSDIIIYPNPVNDELNMFLSGIETGSRIIISNMLGVDMIRTTSNGQTLKLNTSTLPSGVYFISAENSGSKIIKRFVKR